VGAPVWVWLPVPVAVILGVPDVVNEAEAVPVAGMLGVLVVVDEAVPAMLEPIAVQDDVTDLVELLLVAVLLGASRKGSACEGDSGGVGSCCTGDGVVPAELELAAVLLGASRRGSACEGDSGGGGCCCTGDGDHGVVVTAELAGLEDTITVRRRSGPV